MARENKGSLREQGNGRPLLAGERGKTWIYEFVSRTAKYE